MILIENHLLLGVCIEEWYLVGGEGEGEGEGRGEGRREKERGRGEREGERERGGEEGGRTRGPPRMEFTDVSGIFNHIFSPPYVYIYSCPWYIPCFRNENINCVCECKL